MKRLYPFIIYLALAGCQSMPTTGSLASLAVPSVLTPAEYRPLPTFTPRPPVTLGAPLAPDYVDAELPPSASLLTEVKPAKPDAQPITQAERDAAPDLWARMRLSFAFVPTDHAGVQRMAQRYSKGRLLDATQERARLYLYDLLVQAEARGLPAELALLPYVESALNVHAQSHAGAVGLCQFMPATGKRFNLPQSLFVDARRDALRCAAAMYGYLIENHRRFGDWALALAAYNAGEGTVERAIARNKRAGLPTHFAALALPQETRNYVPTLLGLVALITHPERYGATLPYLPNAPSLRSVPLPADVDVRLLASMAGISETALRQYNPALKNIPLVPRAAQPLISLPEGAALKLQQAFDALPKTAHGLASWTAKIIHQPTRVDDLAKQHQVAPDVLRAVNQVPARHVLLTGSTVLIPKSRGEKKYGDIAAKMIESAFLVTKAEPKRHKPKRRVKVLCDCA